MILKNLKNKKACTNCKKHKLFNLFHKNKLKNDGLNDWCKVCVLVAQEKYRKLNKDKINLKHKLYYYSNKKFIRANQRLYENKKRFEDINFRLKKNLRTRIVEGIKNNSKSLNTINLLGCSLEFLKNYLTSQFKEGMNWDNYGYGDDKWHIDHIKPCSKFDLSKPEEQRKCFHYSNLQPLWQIENFEKADKYEQSCTH